MLSSIHSGRLSALQNVNLALQLNQSKNSITFQSQQRGLMKQREGGPPGWPEQPVNSRYSLIWDVLENNFSEERFENFKTTRT